MILNFFVCLLPRLQCQGGINKVIVLKLSQCVSSCSKFDFNRKFLPSKLDIVSRFLLLLLNPLHHMAYCS